MKRESETKIHSTVSKMKGLCCCFHCEDDTQPDNARVLQPAPPPPPRALKKPGKTSDELRRDPSSKDGESRLVQLPRTLPDKAQGSTSPSPPVTKLRKPNLWFRAYQKCEEDKEGKSLLRELWDIVGIKTTPAEDQIMSEEEFVSFSESMKNHVSLKVKELENHKWKIPLVVIPGELDVGEVAEKFVDVIVLAKDFVGSAMHTTSDPYSAVAWFAVCFGIQFVQNPIKGQRDFLEATQVTSGLIQRFEVVEQKYCFMEHLPLLEDAVIELYYRILIFQARALRYLTRHRARRVLTDTFMPSAWKDQIKSIQIQESKCTAHLSDEMRTAMGKQSEAIQGLREELNASAKSQLDGIRELKKKVSELIDSNMTRKLDESSTSLEPRPGQAVHCLPGTRTEIRLSVLGWATDSEHDTPRFYRIEGMAGSGKSTLARSIVQDIKDAGYIVVHFFFDRDIADRSDAKKVVPTIARQLAASSTVLKSSIFKVLRDNPDVFGLPPSDQWKQVIQKSLEEIPKSQVQDEPARLGNSEAARENRCPVVVFIIDALDECSEISRPQLLLGLANLAKMKSVSVRVLITTRLRHDQVQLSLDGLGTEIGTIQLSARPPEEIRGDIRTFYNSKLNLMWEEFRIKQKSHNYRVSGPEEAEWPSEKDIEELLDRTGGLFQYANVACNLIRGPESSIGSPVERLELFLQMSNQGLDETYMVALKSATPSQKDDPLTNLILFKDKGTVAAGSPFDGNKAFFEHFRLIFGTLLLCFNPLSKTSLSAVLGPSISPQHLSEFLAPFYSVLYVPDDNTLPIRVIHPSFRDFLLDNNRCKEPQFRINRYQVHELLFNRCIEMMTSSHGLVDVPKASDETEGWPEVRQDLQYACRFWFNHLTHSLEHCPTPSHEQLQTLLSFFNNFFQRWIVALGYIGKVIEGIEAINGLEDLINKSEYVELCEVLYRDKVVAMMIGLAQGVAELYPRKEKSGSSGAPVRKEAN